MKATRHEVHMSVLDLKHLKQVGDEEQESIYGTRDEQHEKTQVTSTWNTEARKPREVRENVKYKPGEARE